MQPYSEDVGPLLTFSAGFAVGSWLNYDCDWDRRGMKGNIGRKIPQDDSRRYGRNLFWELQEGAPG